MKQVGRKCTLLRKTWIGIFSLSVLFHIAGSERFWADSTLDIIGSLLAIAAFLLMILDVIKVALRH